MNIEIPIQGQPAGGYGGGANPPVQPPISPVQPPNVPPSTPNSPTPPNVHTNDVINRIGGSWSADQNRMVEDVRREMQQRGVLMVPGSSSMTQIINQYGSNLRQQTQQNIRNEYDQSRTQLTNERDRDLRSLKDKRERLIADRYNKFRNVGGTLQDAEEWYDNTYGLSDRKKKREINERYNENLKEINAEEREALKDSDKELISAIRDLTRYFERESRNTTNDDSFLNKLRKEREKAIFERDNAEDEEAARKAAKRANELNQQIKDVTEGVEDEEPEKRDYGARILQMITGVNQFVGGLTSKNLGQMITGTGALITNMLPLSDENQATAMKWLSGAGFIGSMIGQAAQREDAMAGLAAVVRTGGQNIRDIREDLAGGGMYNYSPDSNLPGIFTLGMDEMGFANSAERRMSQSGIGGYVGLSRAYYQEALERALSLHSGSLGALSQYDIYGVTSTNAFAALMKSLEEISGSRVFGGNYAASELYLQMQQGIMQSQMGFSRIPSYDYANTMLTMLENQKGYVADSRTVGEIQALQNMVQNPQNDRQKAILYGIIEKMFPETRGRMDLIERKLQDENSLPQIYTNYLQEIERMYGDENTEMGYFALKSVLPGINSAERRDDVIRAMVNPRGKTYLTSKGVSDFENQYVKMAEDYHSNLTNALNGTVDGIYTAVDKLVKGVDAILGFFGI